MMILTASRRARRRGRTAGQLCWASAAGLSGWVVIAPGVYESRSTAHSWEVRKDESGQQGN